MRSVPEIEWQRNYISSINKQFTEMDKLSYSYELLRSMKHLLNKLITGILPLY